MLDTKRACLESMISISEMTESLLREAKQSEQPHNQAVMELGVRPKLRGEE